jgi:hypothetical protein
MTRLENHLTLLSGVADALGDILDRVVFVGGAIAGLLMTDALASDVRPTDDVDFIVEVATYREYDTLLADLRKKGFKDELTKKDTPICRLKFDEILVDVLPTNGEILGFNNVWYPRAMETATSASMPTGKIIKVVNAPLFVCTKLDAFGDRGKGNYRDSHDIEDVVAVLNSRPELWEESWHMPEDVRKYMKDSFEKLRINDDFQEAMPGMLPYGADGRDRIVNRRIATISKYLMAETFSGTIEFSFFTNPVEAAVISATSYDDDVSFPTRTLATKEDVLKLLRDLGIDDYESPWARGVGRLYPVENIDVALLARWSLVPPILNY